MEYKLIGSTFPCVECSLHAGETVFCESGAMIWMSDNFDMETSAGGVGGFFKKAISGESAFQNFYTAKGDAKIAFGAGCAGDILVFKLDGSQELIMQKGSFLAAEKGVNLEISFQKKLGAGFFGGDGFVMQKVSGTGHAFFEVDGNLHEITLGAGETLMVDTNNLMGHESTVQMEVTTVKGLKNKLLGGEGMFNTKLIGPGKVWLQTASIKGLILSMIPVKS